MKRILLPAGGAAVATGLLAAGLAGTAQAAPDWATDPMATNNAAAVSVIDFWTASNNAALKKATAYYHDTTPAAWKSGGGYSPDGKPGSVVPTGQEKATPAKVKNINLPRTVGKVFWVDSEVIKTALLSLQAEEISYATFYALLEKARWTRTGVSAEDELEQIAEERRTTRKPKEPPSPPPVGEGGQGEGGNPPEPAPPAG